MESGRIVITGVGVVAPNGIGKEEFWKNCLAGVSGIKPVTLFDTSKYRCHHAGEISNFQPEHYLGPKGLRNLDRTTLLALVAAKLAIDDAKLDITDENRNDIGVVLGSTMGSVHSISEFDKEGLREGPRYVNPAKFPNTVINSPASQVAIRFGLKGLNTTIATGFTAGLDAIGYAVDMLKLGRANTLLVGGVEELCIQTFLGFDRLGLLANEPLNGKLATASSMISKGLLLGEGAAFFVLSREHALSGNSSSVIAELEGYGTYFDPHPEARFARTGRAIVEAVAVALQDANLSDGDIDWWSKFGNGSAIFDDADREFEAKATTYPHGPTSDRSLCELIGETFSAGGSLALARVLGAPDHHGQHGLVVKYSPLGTSSAVVVRAEAASTTRARVAAIALPKQIASSTT